jgi:3-mercaptopyruvate sulfurtransferase SseA
MPKTKFALAFSLLFLASLACNALIPAGPTPTMVVIVEPTFPTQAPRSLPQTEADVPRVSLEEALTAYAAGAAIFVDVRSADEYAASHVAGAINIPLNEIEFNPILPNIDQDQWIITYCT